MPRSAFKLVACGGLALSAVIGFACFSLAFAGGWVADLPFFELIEPIGFISFLGFLGFGIASLVAFSKNT